MADFAEKLKDSLQSKVQSVNAAMEKHPDLSGCVVQLPACCHGFEIKVSCPHVDDPAAGAVLCSSRRHCFRLGPGTFPYQGAPMILHSMGSSQWVHAFHIETALSHGILLGDMAAFLATNTGQAFYSEKCILQHLQKGAACWIPAGYVVSVLVNHPSIENMSAVPETANMLAVPILSKELMGRLKPATLSALSTYNASYYISGEPRKVWAPKAALWEKFMVECGVK